MAETKTQREWHQAKSALCYCITDNTDRCMSAEYANALEVVAELLEEGEKMARFADEDGSTEERAVDHFLEYAEIWEWKDKAAAALDRLREMRGE